MFYGLTETIRRKERRRRRGGRNAVFVRNRFYIYVKDFIYESGILYVFMQGILSYICTKDFVYL